MIKKGQLTVFIILALTIAVGGAIGYISIKNNSENNSKNFLNGISIKPGFESIRETIISCRDLSTKEAIDEIALRGGFYEKPTKYFDLGITFVPYYYYEGKYYLPELSTIENELSKSVNKKFSTCLNNIKDDNVKLTFNSPKVKSSIIKSSTSFLIDMSLTMELAKDKLTVQMKDAPIDYKSSLYDIYDVAKYMTESHTEDSYLICISCLTKMADERNLYVDTIDLDKYSQLVIISENYTKSEPYSFVFMNKYSDDDYNKNYTLKFDPAPGMPNPNTN
ncbi:MAG: hypothetical protein WC867_06400 [Candidatus Pacearchaeota archaeon]|jgi:hypothetical protein